MPVIVRVINAKRLLLALVRLERAIGTASATSIGRTLANEGLGFIKRVTPVNRSQGRLPGSRRGYQPFRDQWEVIEKITLDNHYQAVIRNQALDTGGGIALASLEFGARPHRIPKHGYAMMKWHQDGGRSRFGGRSSDLASEINRSSSRPGRVSDTLDIDSSDEAFVLARRVNHPGHKPYRMVAETREHLRRVSNTALAQFAGEIERIFGPLSISP